MSIDIDWDTLTGGPDGDALAQSIRAFVHDRFQKIALPRMIRSVNVKTFEFGDTPPEVELKDVCDPLPDFYEDDEDDLDATPSDGIHGLQSGSRDAKDLPALHPVTKLSDHVPQVDTGSASRPLRVVTDSFASRSPRLPSLSEASNTMTGTPRLPGSMSNLGYFHLPLSAGLSGTSTPLAAVAGAHYPSYPGYDLHHQSRSTPRDRGTSFGSITPPSTLTPSSRPTSRHQDFALHSPTHSPLLTAQRSRSIPDADPSDLQVVARVSYAGNVKLSLTCEILLDYPTQSFVGIPLQLNITGLTFNGIGILAYVKKGAERRAHFCFLAPEDAEAVVSDSAREGGEGKEGYGGLIEEIKVESEIGQKDGGRQVLKNVGKVEKFVLEQVRRIFEDEFVYPSFWTFLV